jgi:hypothetical protein
MHLKDLTKDTKKISDETLEPLPNRHGVLHGVHGV